MFTGKNREDFEKWLYNKDNKDFTKPITEDLGCGYDGCVDFYLESNDVFDELPFSMQQGVYLEYLDSVGFYIYIGSSSYTIRGRGLNKRLTFNNIEPRQEALKEAFKKVDELINECY